MLDEIQDIISEEFDVDKSEVTPEATLRGDLHIDSMAAVNLSFEIEGKFDVKISDEELANLKTVGDIVSLLESKKAVSSK